MTSNGKKAKYFHEIYDDKVCVEQVGAGRLKISFFKRGMRYRSVRLFDEAVFVFFPDLLVARQQSE